MLSTGVASWSEQSTTSRLLTIAARLDPKYLPARSSLAYHHANLGIVLTELGEPVEAAAAVGAVVAGVDLLPGPNGEMYVIEVNAVPGWRALAPACGLDVAKLTLRFLAEEYRP